MTDQSREDAWANIILLHRIFGEDLEDAEAHRHLFDSGYVAASADAETRIEALTIALRACETALVLGKTREDDICASCGVDMRQSAGHHTGACEGDITGSGRVSKARELTRAALADLPQQEVES